MSEIDPEVCKYLKSARARTTGALAALGEAHIRPGNIVAERQTEADRDVLVDIQVIISDLQRAKGSLDLVINRLDGEGEE